MLASLYGHLILQIAVCCRTYVHFQACAVLRERVVGPPESRDRSFAGLGTKIDCAGEGQQPSLAGYFGDPEGSKPFG
jgi:hypothetical protein